MADHVVSIITSRDALDASGMTMADIVTITGLGWGSVRRAFMGGPKRINIKTAELIARALGLSMNEIEWPSELTHVGRPPLTGGTYTVGAGVTSGLGGDGEFDYPVMPEQVVRRTMRVQTEYCTNPEHNLLLPLSGKCDACAA